MTRFYPRSVLAALALLLFPLPSRSAERNVILIVTDDQSPTLGCYGDPVASSPHVDSLARDGMRFDRAYATTASCSASRSVILSGLHNHHNGQYGHTHAYHKFESFRDTISLSLPVALARAGYRTAQVGKYHVAPEEVYHFDTYIQASSRNPVEMAERSKAFVADDSNRPFFLYYATSDPHRSGQTDPNSSLRLAPNLFGNPLPGESYEGIEETHFHPENVPVPPFLPDTPESRAELAQYYQSCARVDQGVGRLIEILKEAGLYDSTLIIFTADHGMAFAGGKTTVYEGGLRVPFVVRDPYQQKRGVASDSIISHTDITPSILDFARALDHQSNRPTTYFDPDGYWEDKEHVFRENLGYHAATSYHGHSWLPILADPSRSIRELGFGSHTFHEITMYYPMRTVWDGQYKLIWNIAHGLPYPFASDLWASSSWQAQLARGPDAPYGKFTVDSYVNRPAFELYDVSHSSYEGRNLADDPEFAHVLQLYKKKLRQRQEETQDPWILKWEYE